MDSDLIHAPRSRIANPLIVAENNIKVASLLDLAGMKVAVVQKRAEAKDHVDLDTLIRAGISLPGCLAAGRLIYKSQFNAQITLKALAYFGEPGLASLPEPMKARLKRAVAAVDLEKLPLTPHRQPPKTRPGGRDDR